MSIRRDYKPASTWQHRRRSVRRHGLLVVTLVLIGLFGGLLAYVKGKGDWVQQAATTAAAPPGVSASAASDHAAAAARTPPARPETLPAPLKPKYDFYTELPRRQIQFRRNTPDPGGFLRQPFGRIRPEIEPPRKLAPPRENQTEPLLIEAAADRVVLGHA